MGSRWNGLEIIMVNPNLQTEKRASKTKSYGQKGKKWTPEMAVVYHDGLNKEGACD